MTDPLDPAALDELLDKLRTSAVKNINQGWQGDANDLNQAADAIAALRAERVKMIRERDALRALLLRWLQAHNKMDGKSGLSIAEFDALRQETHNATNAARQAAGEHG